MKRKLITGLGAILLTAGIGTAVYADAGGYTFEDMLPFMKQMHPQATEQQLNDMYENCHGSGGMMENYRGSRMMDGENGFMPGFRQAGGPMQDF